MDAKDAKLTSTHEIFFWQRRVASAQGIVEVDRIRPDSIKNASGSKRNHWSVMYCEVIATYEATAVFEWKLRATI